MKALGLLCSAFLLPYDGVLQNHGGLSRDGVVRMASGNDMSLDDIARKMKMKVFDLDEQIFGIDSNDASYGIEVVNVLVANRPPFGLGLVEKMGATDGRGLVLVEEVAESSPASQAVKATSLFEGTARSSEKERIEETGSAIALGDSIVAVVTYLPDADRQGFRKKVDRVEGLNLDSTLDAIRAASAATKESPLVEKFAGFEKGFIGLSLKRLVRRNAVDVEVIARRKAKKNSEDLASTKIQVLCGANLRMELIRKSLELYDPRTRRFDQPFSTGDCGGEGVCGTCTISVLEGADQLSPPDQLEASMMRGQGVRWRLACRAFVGPENKAGKLKIRLRPQEDK